MYHTKESRSRLISSFSGWKEYTEPLYTGTKEGDLRFPLQKELDVFSVYLCWTHTVFVGDEPEWKESGVGPVLSLLSRNERLKSKTRGLNEGKCDPSKDPLTRRPHPPTDLPSTPFVRPLRSSPWPARRDWELGPTHRIVGILPGGSGSLQRGLRQSYLGEQYFVIYFWATLERQGHSRVEVCPFDRLLTRRFKSASDPQVRSRIHRFTHSQPVCWTKQMSLDLCEA